MAKKYDTNSLEDPSESIHKTAATESLPDNAPVTTNFPPPTLTEDQTRKLDDPADPLQGLSRPSGDMSAAYRPPMAVENPKIRGIGLTERTAITLSYLPGIGFAVGFLILFLAPSNEVKVRFHAAQSVAAHAFIGIVIAILNAIGAEVASGIFGLVTFIVMLTFTWRAWKRKPVYIESVNRATEWLEEKTSPKK